MLKLLLGNHSDLMKTRCLPAHTHTLEATYNKHRLTLTGYMATAIFHFTMKYVIESHNYTLWQLYT